MNTLIECLLVLFILTSLCCIIQPTFFRTSDKAILIKDTRSLVHSIRSTKLLAISKSEQKRVIFNTSKGVQLYGELPQFYANGKCSGSTIKLIYKNWQSIIKINHFSGSINVQYENIPVPDTEFNTNISFCSGCKFI